MPVYELRCENCGEVFEELLGLEDALPPCPSCGKPTEKCVSMPGPLKRNPFPFKLSPPAPKVKPRRG